MGYGLTTEMACNGNAFYLPITKSGILNKDRNRIWLLASTEDPDEEGETLIQKAMDVHYMTQDGKVTWGHSPRFGLPDPKNILGEIVLARIDPAGVYAEATLMPWKEHAATILADLQAIDAGNIPMNVYKASIEGQYKLFSQPDGTICKSAIVRNIALDPNVVNTHTMIGLAKASKSGGGIRQCNCELIRQEKHNLSSKEAMTLLIEHLALCKGMSNFNDIKRLILSQLSTQTK